MTDNPGKDAGQSSGRLSGASKAAIQAHYDVGNGFYQLWLDSSMTYSCGIWDKEDVSLEQAQDRKVRYHLDGIDPSGADSVLEIGCGWGACLKKLVTEYGVKEVVGLTLSAEQKSWVDQMKLEGVEVRCESWADHSPQKPYDAIVSLAAIPHFVRPELDRNERVAIYRDFFSKCHQWLKPAGKITIETQVYGQGSYIPTSSLSKIFPESDMPHLHELIEGFNGVFDLSSMINHRLHYPRTLRCWLANLEEHRDEAISVAGIDAVDRYNKFMKAGIRGHESGVFGLMRINLTKSW